jgi:hypothetical protein
MFELPCMHAIVEKNVNFTKGAVFGLGEPEPTPDIAQKVGPSIEQTGFGTPVPCYFNVRA